MPEEPPFREEFAKVKEAVTSAGDKLLRDVGESIVSNSSMGLKVYMSVAFIQTDIFTTVFSLPVRGAT